ncbi:MAG: hypothetical protein ACM3RX_05715 [Methanococcaceae archaeon]
MHGDTLYCLGDSLFRYIPSLNKWESVCKPEPLTSDPQSTSEMIFLKDKLYAMQTYFANAADTYEIHFDGTVHELQMWRQNGYAGAKYIKPAGDCGWCYVRGQYYCGGFFTFDGTAFTELKNGLTSEEWNRPPTNSMAIKNDTLFAGFRKPGSIKYLNNGTWTAYTDTLPLSKNKNLKLSWLRAEPTAITFVKNRLFAATHILGVLEWVKGKGWVLISDGLVKIPPPDMDYDPVVFLESINNTLVAAYGQPGYAPWGGVGVYKLHVN